MIEIDKTPRFKTADGQLFMTLELSQIHAIATILGGTEITLKDDENAAVILKHSTAIIAILKMKPRKQRTVKPKNKPTAKPVAK